jgi:hypothetical protein
MNQPRLGTRGQVTLWILIGIVMMIVILSTVYVVTRISSPVSIQSPVQDYVESCMTRVTEDALVHVGERGGYFEGESSSRSLSLASGLTLPYWYYLNAEPTCETCPLVTNLRTDDEVERAVEQYILKHFSSCTQEFTAFAKDGLLITELQKPGVEVIIGPNDVRSVVNWPLHIKTLDGATRRINRFASRSDIPLGRILDEARTRVKTQVTDEFIEQIMMHLITIHGDVKFDKLPPLAAVTHGSSIVSWSKGFTKEQLRDLFSRYFPLVGRVSPVTNNSLEAGLFKALSIPSGEFETTYSYLGWDYHLDITPSREDELLPDVDRNTFPRDLVSPFQTNYYEFFYDLQVPYLLHLKDPTARGGKGYSFVMGLQANIRDNKRMQEWLGGNGTLGLWNVEVNVQAKLPGVNTGVCSCGEGTGITECVGKPSTCDLTSKTYPNVTSCLTECAEFTEPEDFDTVLTNELFCDTSFGVSPTRIRVRDSVTTRVIPDALVSFSCGTFGSCPLRETDRRGILDTSLTSCTNGGLQIRKEGYHMNAQSITTAPGVELDLLVNLTPVITVPLELTVRQMDINLTNETGRDCCTDRPLLREEQVIITFDRTDAPKLSPFSKVAYNKGLDYVIELIPGEYSINVQLIDDYGYLLGKGCMQVSTFEALPKEDILVRPGIVGGLHLSNVTISDPYSMRSLNLSVIRIPLPDCITSTNCVIEGCVGVDELSKIPAYSNRYVRDSLFQ